MKQIPWKTYLFWVLLAEAVGGLSGWLTRDGARQYAETITLPPFSPPGIVFPIVWTVLFALMGIGAARVWLAALWVLILWMLLSFYRVDPLAGWLQLPYLLWVAFAGYLNLGVWILNG